MTHPYHEAYLDEIVETQGRLFDSMQEYHKEIDTKDFITSYMKSRTREFIDQGQAYVSTMSSRELWDYFCENEQFKPREGDVIGGFVVDWIGEFYAYFQWYYNIPSKEVIELVSIDFLLMGYQGLHDLELDLAVKKVGSHIFK